MKIVISKIIIGKHEIETDLLLEQREIQYMSVENILSKLDPDQDKDEDLDDQTDVEEYTHQPKRGPGRPRKS